MIRNPLTPVVVVSVVTFKMSGSCYVSNKSHRRILSEEKEVVTLHVSVVWLPWLVSGHRACEHTLVFMSC